MHKPNRRIVILLISLLVLSNTFAAERKYTKDNIRNLNDEWELFLEKSPAETFVLADKNIAADFKVTVPNQWNKQIILSGKKSPETYGCYRYVCSNLNPLIEYAFHIKESPGTSCAVYVNRKLIGQAGDPFAILSKEYNQKPNHYGPSHSKSMPLYFEFTPDQNGQAEIIVFVTNYYYRKGGLWDSVYVGPANAIWHLNIITLIFYCIVIGSLIFTGLLNIVQFFLNKTRTAYFYLGIASFAFAIRIATAGYCSLDIFFPNLTAELKVNLEMIPMWVVPVAILQLIFLIYPYNTKTVFFKFLPEKVLRYTLIIITLTTGLLTFILPAWYSNRLIPFLQVLMIIFALYILTYSAYNLLQKKRYSLYHFMSFFIIAAGGIIDIVHQSSKAILPIPTLPVFILIFVIVQIIMLSAVQNDIYKETLQGSDELRSINEACLKFLPENFLSLLNKESIIQAKLGNYSNIEMSIMISMIDFSASEKNFSLEEQFSFLNEFLKDISPSIEKNNGFISKFLSNGFIALFPKSETDAIQSALEITEKAKSSGITSRTSIHFGKMILGIIGEENRLEDSIISGTVNIAFQLQDICSKYNKKLIISESIEEKLSPDFLETIKLKSLKQINVIEKEKPLKIYEVSRKKTDGKKEAKQI